MAAQFTDEQVMFCLAGLSYQGFIDGAAGRFHTEVGRQTIVQGLRSLKPLDGGWDIVWGPTSYRAPLSLLDDELMFVVRKPGVTDRYAVVIRGTNPVSAFDWVFGDLWAARQVPWPYDNTGAAKVSLSAALGLAILKNLRSGVPRPSAPASLLQAVTTRLRDIGGQVAEIVDQLAGLVVPRIALLRRDLTDVLGEFARLRATYQAVDVNSHVTELARLWESEATANLLRIVDQAAALSNGRIDRAILGLFEDEARLRARLGEGIDLLTFLAAAVKAAGNRSVDVIVTGHSKGGGLASTVALWLEQTRGKGAHDPKGWDPDLQATVHCYSYAGPTAGNAAFATLSNEKIGAHCHRIANTRDVVPHAWARTDLEKIPSLYDPTVPRLPALGPLAKIITGVTVGLGYTQVGNLVTEFEGSYEGAPPFFFPQFVHQHMDAYIQYLLPEAGITTRTFFDPLEALPR
jgi:hypothetical protein